MAILSRDLILDLAKTSASPSVSIYLPIPHQDMGFRQAPVRLKNMVRDAEERLVERGVRRPDAQDILRPASDLIGDEVFWRERRGGVAFLLAEGVSHQFDLPVEADENLVVNDRFHVRPLLALLAGDRRFYVLALSQKKLRLIECTQHSLREVDLTSASVPTSMVAALGTDDPERQLQFRTSGSGGAGRSTAMYHGHGEEDQDKARIHEYFLRIDRPLQGVLGDSSAPLILAGVDYLLPMYAAVNTYKGLVEQGVQGSADETQPEKLRDDAWALVEPRFRENEERAHARFRELLGTGMASAGLNEVIAAAIQGRIEALWLPKATQVWGTVEPETGKAAQHTEQQPGDEDLLDFAATHTLANRGVVYVVETEQMPNDAPIAAVFRYLAVAA